MATELKALDLVRDLGDGRVVGLRGETLQKS